MQAILNVKEADINNNLLNIIKELFLKNIEVIIRRESIQLEEFDKNLPLDSVIKEFAEAGYSKEFLKDLKEGFETSTAYIKK